MVQLGRYNRLKILRQLDIGYFLDGAEFGDILLPHKQIPAASSVGDDIEVFLYNDSEDRVIATTQTPKAQVGECAYLKAISRNPVGVFMDWGLPKDLLVPFSEQQKPMQQGYSYTVYVFVDEASQRIAASTRLEDHLSDDNREFKPGQAVELMIYGKSDLGFKAVVNGTHLGQLYSNETFRHLHHGEKLPGYIKLLRSDGKIDLSLQGEVTSERDRLAQAILDHLKHNEGVSNLTDKSPPDDIYQTFGVSKANYKKALGQLYKQRSILIEKHQITLL